MRSAILTSLKHRCQVAGLPWSDGGSPCPDAMSRPAACPADSSDIEDTEPATSQLTLPCGPMLRYNLVSDLLHLWFLCPATLPLQLPHT